MVRTISTAVLLASVVAMSSVTAANADNKATVEAVAKPDALRHVIIDEFSAQSRKTIYRTPRRVRIDRNTLGPNAVRVCNARYEQEYRPSGTVIVPRMTCYWRG